MGAWRRWVDEDAERLERPIFVVPIVHGIKTTCVMTKSTPNGYFTVVLVFRDDYYGVLINCLCRRDRSTGEGGV